ncbi:MAG: hypothetical protein ACOX0W_04180 [Sphaerochaetaceae bacterium]|jgi:iron-sulfur cluster repair protein YtfE (RIC family)
MEKTSTFSEVKKQHFKTLQQFVPIVARVHGGTHPEFLKVHDTFISLEKKIQKAGSLLPDLEEEFRSLRSITSDYTIPDDVCESYEAVYVMLSELDRAYRS